MRTMSINEITNLPNEANKKGQNNDHLIYQAVPDATHFIVIPTEIQSAVEGIHNIKFDGKFTNVPCPESDCAVCAGVSKVWGIINKRIEEEVDPLNLSEEDRKKATTGIIKDEFDQSGLQNATEYTYTLVAQLEGVTSAAGVLNFSEVVEYTTESGELVQVPKFNLVIRKVTKTYFGKIVELATKGGYPIARGLFSISYTDTTDKMLLGKNRTEVAVAISSITDKYPYFMEAVDKAVADFIAEHGSFENILKATFKEFIFAETSKTKEIVKGATTQAKFKQFDEYVEQAKANPELKYAAFVINNGGSKVSQDVSVDLNDIKPEATNTTNDTNTTNTEWVTADVDLDAIPF